MRKCGLCKETEEQIQEGSDEKRKLLVLKNSQEVAICSTCVQLAHAKIHKKSRDVVIFLDND